MSLPPVLSVNEVMGRYGMRDPRTARRLMNTAGAFKMGGRLVVREDMLDAHEKGLAAPKNPPLQLVPKAKPRKPARGASTHRPDPSQGADWWRPTA